MRARGVLIVGFLCAVGAVWHLNNRPTNTFAAEAASIGMQASVILQQEQPPSPAPPPIIIIGEGGTSGFLFQYAAKTYAEENGGIAYTVHDGDEFVSAMQDFSATYGPIQQFVYFGHGNEVGLYVNQAPGINGALYANDPALNTPFRAASIYDLPRDVFHEKAIATFYGCNVARDGTDIDSFAEQFANHFGTTVIAATGPTEFSFEKDSKTSISPYASVITQPLYMIPTAEKKGFVTVTPAERVIYDDVHASSVSADAIDALTKRGLLLNQGTSFFPYRSTTYADAYHFCTVLNPDAACAIDDHNPTDTIRNTAALKMLLDAAGYELQRTQTAYEAQIYFANMNNLLTPDFIRKRWYTRGEMAMLTYNILRFNEEH